MTLELFGYVFEAVIVVFLVFAFWQTWKEIRDGE